jgi:NAD-dependent DNA ligase
MLVGFTFDRVFQRMSPLMSKAQQDIIKTINTDWMSKHLVYWDDDDDESDTDVVAKRMLLGRGTSHTYKILNPGDFHPNTLERLLYSKEAGEVMFEDTRSTHVCCEDIDRDQLPQFKKWMANMQSLCNNEEINDDQYFYMDRFVMKVLGYKQWADVFNSDIPADAFKKITMDKFIKLRDILNFPTNMSDGVQNQVISVLSFDDKKYLSKTLLDQLKKDKLKIASVSITLQVDKQIVPIKAKARVSPSNNTKVVLLSGFRDANLERRAALKGWEVKANFSKSVNLVVVKDVKKETVKITKARENGISIITKEDFERMV